MVRFADILKNLDKNKESPPLSSAQGRENISLSEDFSPSPEDANLYKETLTLVKELFRKNVDYEAIDIHKLIAQIEKVVDQIIRNEKDLLMLAFLGDSQSEDTQEYLCYDSVNTCVFSLVMGKASGYEREELMELGLSALLHDIGMVKYYDLISQPRQLTKTELKEIKEHPSTSVAILNRFAKYLPQTVLQVVYQHHERINRTGYPQGLGRELINSHAMIVGLADVYEALIHHRPYRQEFMPFEAMERILADKESFEYRLIKVLIEKIGIFPVGSWVEMSDGSIAEVIKINSASPLRPIVRKLYNAKARKIEKPEIINLAQCPDLSIKRGIKRRERGDT
ncbi:MAG: HD domain-containing protein [Candidatus Omnitrophica bacterium]|nr:HD domain-containing protein [Candidatus Omnitrophota bacterium]MCM8771169.1 HD domain-containing protein [Candidatus Omnitrophota bacterium]